MTENWTAEKVEEILRIATLSDVVSLDAPVVIDGEEASTFGELQASDEPSPEELIINSMTGEKLIEMMNKLLTSREREVLLSRFGFHGNPESLQEIAERMNPKLTRERVRQIESCAIRKLRRKLKESDFRG